MIQLSGVDLLYRAGNRITTVLEQLDLDIEAGSITAVIGPSGCGKSSLLKLIAGLIRPTLGEIRLAGASVTGPRADTGIAFQNPTLMPWRSVLQNILISVEVSSSHRAQYRRDRAAFVARGSQLLQSVGLGGYEEARAWELSGGMQQRVSLCRALIHKPITLLLDEPFAALDELTREDLWNVVQELFLAQRPTVVLITHDLREAVYLADRVLVMGRCPGRIIGDARIELPRPRSEETLFAADFSRCVLQLRQSIGRAMQQ